MSNPSSAPCADLASPAPARASQRIAALYARPGFLLRRAHQISVAVFENACADIELTPQQFAVLTALYARPGSDQTSLARALGIDKVTISHLLRGLEKRGLVLRAQTEQNRRSFSIALTKTGAKLLEEAEPRVERAYRQLLAPLTSSQRQQLLELLGILTARLDPLARTKFTPISAPVPASGRDR
jgi:DNA-binding MarR family transcriptional regulator